MSLEFRKKVITVGFEWTSKLYTSIIKRNQPAWDINIEDLLDMEEESLGYHLGVFLKENNFQLIPRAERHDCFHVLCNYNTEVESEIALQYLRIGNGARSIYSIGAVVVGTVLLPEHLDYYIESFLIGKKAAFFQKLDFKDHLTTSLEVLRVQHFEQIQFINPIL